MPQAEKCSLNHMSILIPSLAFQLWGIQVRSSVLQPRGNVKVHFLHEDLIRKPKQLTVLPLAWKGSFLACELVVWPCRLFASGWRTEAVSVSVCRPRRRSSGRLAPKDLSPKS